MSLGMLFEDTTSTFMVKEFDGVCRFYAVNQRGSRFEGYVHVNVNTKSEDWKISTKWSLVWRWWLTSIFLVLRFYTFYTLVTRMIGSLRHALKTAVTGGHMGWAHGIRLWCPLSGAVRLALAFSHHSVVCKILDLTAKTQTTRNNEEIWLIVTSM